MNALEEDDAEDTDGAMPSPETIHEVLKHLNEKKDLLQNWLEQIEAIGGKEIGTVDPDAHMMHQGGDGRNLEACYNVQTADAN